MTEPELTWDDSLPPDTELHIIKAPEMSDWECHIFGPQGVAITPKKGHVPNWFHRKMQELIFGVKWKRKV